MVSESSTLADVDPTTLTLALFDDNPATLDLLGFDAVVIPVLAALRQPDLDPITIGVHAPWGAGKSTLHRVPPHGKGGHVAGFLEGVRERGHRAGWDAYRATGGHMPLYA